MLVRLLMESIYHEAFAKLCALASYDARKRGFCIDFLEKLQLRRLDKRFWTLYVECDKQLCTCLPTTEKIHFSIDSHFMDFPSSVDSYSSIKVALLPAQDLKEILKMLASHGAFITVDPPDKEHIEAMMHDANLKREQLYDTAMAIYKKHRKESDEYKASIEDIKRYENEYNSLMSHLHDKLKPILLYLVKQPYTSLEEMLVDIDLKTYASSV